MSHSSTCCWLAAVAAVATSQSLKPQALAKQHPGALSRLSGFKVVRDGYGSLEWLEPVDVRDLDLEDTVQIARGGLS